MWDRDDDKYFNSSSSNVHEAMKNIHISSGNANNNRMQFEIPEGITSQEREAAEVLLQMGAGTPPRKSVITDTRSVLKTSYSGGGAPSSGSSGGKGVGVNLKNAFVPIHAAPTVKQTSPTTGVVYTPQATKSPVPLQQFSASSSSSDPSIPISFVQRQEGGATVLRGKSSKLTRVKTLRVSSPPKISPIPIFQRPPHQESHLRIFTVPQTQADKTIPAPENLPINIRFDSVARFERTLHDIAPRIEPLLAPKDSKKEQKNLSEMQTNPIQVFPFGPQARIARMLDHVGPRIETSSSTKSSKEERNVHVVGIGPPQQLKDTQHFTFGGSSASGGSASGGIIRIIQGTGPPSSAFVGASTNLFVPGLGLPPGATLVHLTSPPPPPNKSAPTATAISGNLPPPPRKELSPLNANGVSLLTEQIHQHRKKLTKAEKQAIRAKVPLVKDASQPIEVDGFQIPREYWAKAFVQSDICHAAGILFKALFSPEEIQKCTLRGRNGTSLLNLQKRSAIFRVVGWMKHKNQNPYSFNTFTTPYNPNQLSHEEKMMIEKKVFVERRYQTSRKIRECPYKRPSKRIPPVLPTPVALLPPPPPLELVEEIVVKIKPEPIESEYYEGDYTGGQISMDFVKIKSEPKEEEEENEMDTGISGDGGDKHLLDGETKPPSPKQSKLEQQKDLKI